MHFGTLPNIALATLIFPLCVHARVPDKAQWSNLQSLHPQQKLIIFHTNGQKDTCRFREISEQSIALRSRHGDISIPRADVLKVTVGSGLVRLRNTAIGAGIGGGVGALLATKTDARGH